MKRSLILSLCAVALASISFSAVQAQTVDVALNLRYTDPADASEGGTWQLVARVDSGLGIAAVNAILENINNGVAPDDIMLGVGIGAIDPIDLGGANERPAYLTFNGGVGTDLIYGQDISVAAVGAVGTGLGTPGDNGTDALNNPLWDNAALLASGTFGGLRPGFTTNGTSVTDSNVFTSTTAPIAAAAATATTNRVRGDLVGTDSLILGDHNRDHSVDGLDLDSVLFSFLTAVPAATAWFDGDSTDDDFVNGLDLDNVLFAFLTNQIPPAISAVPEPASFVLLGLGAVSILGMRRRKG